MTNNKSIEVVFSPALIQFHDVKNKIVVVIDILRATSSICVAFQTGVKKILPVATPEECKIYKEFDFVIAAERNAMKVENFDLGNSPFEFENPLLAGKSIAFTTTNGTKAIKLAKENGAAKIVIASFLNIDFLCNWLLHQNESVVLLCSGWKDKFNIEDSLFAGAVVLQLEKDFIVDCDSAIAAKSLYSQHETNLEEIIRQSSHAKRFKLLHLQTDDVSFCLQKNTTPLLPILEDEYLVRM